MADTSPKPTLDGIAVKSDVGLAWGRQATLNNEYRGITDNGPTLYSLRPILLVVNIDVPRHILVVDISVLVKSNMDRREYMI
jgi:hypothetical protein